jgi:multisubunit Na+/H+ antiporter MnhB subunit
VIEDPIQVAPQDLRHPYTPPASTQQSERASIRHSGLGIASFAISIVAAMATLAAFTYAGYVEVSTPGGMDENSPTAILVGMAMLACGGLLLLGLILGIAGALQRDRRKIFAVLGALINGLVLGGATLLIVIGFNMAP